MLAVLLLEREASVDTRLGLPMLRFVDCLHVSSHLVISAEVLTTVSTKVLAMLVVGFDVFGEVRRLGESLPTN